ncbi:hypothetical protein [Kocuria turfanensis]|uniref:Uncharacterized protein n=1 Tax=Kocuria turfanensis TaxID=388357 RepID=A0A512IGP7_9MICC|nr:hypothetical protein [Kocuria turfanensis]GEO96861.1 hypothetical protein KTU01_29840 [Kocuria turfanensis]
MNAGKTPQPAGSPMEQLLAAVCLGGLLPLLSWLLDSYLVALVCSLALSFVISGLLRQRALLRRGSDRHSDPEHPTT